MNFKFLLVLTMILCAFCILPVSAVPNVHIIQASQNNFNFNVNDEDTIYISYLRPYLQQYTRMPANVIISDDNINGAETHVSTTISQTTTTINLWDFLDTNNNIMPYKVLFNYDHLPYIDYTLSVDGSAFNTYRISFTYSDGYSNGLETAKINASIDHYTDDTVTYNVQCISNNDNVTYTIIRGNDEFNIGYLTSEETETEITTGHNGTTVYSWAFNEITGSSKLLEIYLEGRNELIEPTPTPTPTPTDTPVYPDRIQAFIQTYDYQTGNILSGVNMSVYEVSVNGDNFQIGNKIFSSINAESQTILMVKNDTEYFIENELDGYFAVKNTNIISLNNRYGYLWNPTISNPLKLYYSRLDPTAQYNVGFIVQDTSNNGLSGVSVTMDNSITKISNSIGGITFNNVSSGTHTFIFIKNGYQTAQITKDIQMQYATFYQTLFADNQIIQPTVQPTAYPTVQPTTQPTIAPIDQPSNLGESIKYGLAKMFGVNSLNTINLIFALLIILFPAVIGGVVTNQALGFIAGGLIGFVFALGIGLIPIWVFFSMIMLSVIYLVMTHAESGF